MKRTFALVTILILIGGLAMASGGQGETVAGEVELSTPGQFPIVKETLNLTGFINHVPNLVDMQTNDLTLWMEEKTNIHIEWDAIPASSDSKTRWVLMLNSGEKLPDIMLGLGISHDEKYLYGSQGFFLPMNDYIEKQGYYINDVLKASPGFVKESAGPDGNVYVLTSYEECYHCLVAQKVWINEIWLDNLGMETPTTTEEFREVLRAFKTKDPNGNGKADELPFSGQNDTWHSKAWPFLMNAFIYTDDGDMLNVEGGKVIASFAQPEWREGMRYINSLFDEGLIDEQMFVRDSSALKQLVEGEYNRVGAAPIGHRGQLGAYRGEMEGGSGDFRALAPLKGPKGHQSAGYFPAGPKQSDSAVITKDSAYPEAVYKWIDLTFSQEFSIRNWFGVFEKDWKWPDSDAVGIDGSKAIYQYIGVDPMFMAPQYNGGWVHSSTYFMPGKLFGGQAGVPGTFNYEGFLITESHKLMPYLPEKYVPRMSHAAEDAETIAELRTVVNTFVYESAAKFITGRMDINNDAEWNDFLGELDKIGLDEYLQIMNKTYERYR
jgi:putative aldouronate transport system substrate-binding protein